MSESLRVRPSWQRRLLSAALGALLPLAVLVVVTSSSPAVADIAPDPGTPATISADPLPTAQINGVVWDQVIVGNTVYVAGSFTEARPAGVAVGGAGAVARSNLMAYNINNGQIVAGWAPTTNGQVLTIAASPDGSRLYIGGQFTQVNGVTRSRIAAISPSNGALVTTFNPGAETTVRALAVTSTTVYYGGDFKHVGAVARGYAAAVAAGNGALLAWNPNANDAVNAMTLTYDKTKVILGGHFDQMSGVTNRGMASVDATTGALQPWAINQTVEDYGDQAAILDLEADAGGVWGSGYNFGGPGHFLEGVFRADPDTGAIIWIEDCHGDTYSVYPAAQAVYSVGHAHYCGTIGGFPQTDPWTFRHSLAFTRDATHTANGDSLGYPAYAGTPTPTLLHFEPRWQVGTYTGQGQATWNVTGNSKYVVYGGEFPRVGNQVAGSGQGLAQQGLVRFAYDPNDPQGQAPGYATQAGPKSNAGLIPSVKAWGPTSARVSFVKTWDADNETLTYKVYRNFTNINNTPIYQVTAKSNSWTLGNIAFTDKTVQPGKTYNYRVYVYDSEGNYTTNAATSITMPTDMPASAYRDAVYDDEPDSLYRLDETSGTAVVDSAGSAKAVSSGGVTLGAAGATGDGDTAYTFDGSTGLVATQTAVPGPTVFAAEAWIKTTTTSGGKILGFGNAASGNSSSYDRHLYMLNSGRIVFGVYPGAVRTITSPASYNDGQWHHIVAQLSPAGMELFVDGARVAQRTDTTSAQSYSGYWRIGGDNMGGWDSTGSSYFSGSVDDVAIYSKALSLASIRKHYVASGRSLTNAAPTASFTSDQRSLHVSLDASASSDPEGSALTYSWDFGDGSPAGEGVQTSHAYASAGTYTIILTATDDEGATATATHTVTTTEPQAAPSDAYGAAIFAADPRFYWRLDESGGSTAADSSSAGTNPGTIKGGVTLGAEGAPLRSHTATAGSFNGSDGFVVDQKPVSSPGAFSQVLWFKTTSTSGGKLMGFGDQSSGTSSNYDRHTYMSPDGHLNFGVWTGSANVASTTTRYNDGQWHMLVATRSLTDGLKLYVDGGEVGSNAQTGAQDYTGYWRVGGDTSWDGSPFFQGSIDDVALFERALSAADIAHLYSLAQSNQPPTAAFNTDVNKRQVSLDASASSDTEGPIASYTWDFGDGATTTQSDPTVTHTYAASGTYTIKLTVTDEDGTTAQTTHDVTVSANQSPVAAFSSSATQLSVDFNASASSDADGTVASYAWDFGDDSTGAGATPSHTYAAAGTYTVKLTVTDDDGASDVVSHDVTVSVPAGNPPFAADLFSRSVTNGWGTADTGGAWTASGTASWFSVAGGQATITIGRAGAGPGAYLNAVSQTDADVRTDITLDSLPVGGAVIAGVVGRGNATNAYRGRVTVQPSGALAASFSKVVAGSETTLMTKSLTGISLAAGQTLQVRLQVTGSSPTTLRLKVWKSGTAEPDPWTITTTDSAGPQTAGGVGMWTYLAGSATSVPLSVKYSAFVATATH